MAVNEISGPTHMLKSMVRHDMSVPDFIQYLIQTRLHVYPQPAVHLQAFAQIVSRTAEGL